jgi:hypothetical protein
MNKIQKFYTTNEINIQGINREALNEALALAREAINELYETKLEFYFGEQKAKIILEKNTKEEIVSIIHSVTNMESILNLQIK